MFPPDNFDGNAARAFRKTLMVCSSSGENKRAAELAEHGFCVAGAADVLELFGGIFSCGAAVGGC